MVKESLNKKQKEELYKLKKLAEYRGGTINS